MPSTKSTKVRGKALRSTRNSRKRSWKSGKARAQKLSKARVSRKQPRAISPRLLTHKLLTSDLGKEAEIVISPSDSHLCAVRNMLTSNPKSSQNEIVFTYIDYLDSSGSSDDPGQQYLVDLNNLPDFAASGSSGYNPVARIRSVKMYAIPRFNASDSSQSSALFVTGVPVLPGATVGSATTTDSVYAGQMTTLVTPSSTVDWVLVGEWYADRTLEQSNLVLALNNTGLTALMEWEVLDPDFMAASTDKFQLRFEFEVAQTLPQITTLPVAIPTFNDPWNGPKNGEAARTAVVFEADKIINRA